MGHEDSLLTSTLDDEHILISHRAADLNAGLSVRKLLQTAFSSGRSESLADGICESRVGGTREDLNTAHCAQIMWTAIRCRPRER